MATTNAPLDRKEVHLLVCPLKAYTGHRLDRLDWAAKHQQLHRVPLRRYQHWAIQVDGEVFEVTSNDRDDRTPGYRRITRPDWWISHEYNKWMVVDRLMGFSRYEGDDIHTISTWIWDVVMGQKYSCWSTNCQMFASILKNVIVDNNGLAPDVASQLDCLPRPMNPWIAIGEKASRIRRLVAESGKMAMRPLTGGDREKDQGRKSASPPRLPIHPSKEWLMALRSVSRTADLQDDQALFDLLMAANKKQKQQRFDNLRRTLTWNAPPRSPKAPWKSEGSPSSSPVSTPTM